MLYDLHLFLLPNNFKNLVQQMRYFFNILGSKFDLLQYRRSKGFLRRVCWFFYTGVSGQRNGPSFESLSSWTSWSLKMGPIRCS
jgi:hypothetical protein